MGGAAAVVGGGAVMSGAAVVVTGGAVVVLCVVVAAGVAYASSGRSYTRILLYTKSALVWVVCASSGVWNTKKIQISKTSRVLRVGRGIVIWVHVPFVISCSQQAYAIR